MCTKKPGPRCSNHTKKAYAKAQKAFDANPSTENKKTLDKAKADYYTSPEGIKRLRDAGKHEVASKMQARRDRMASELKTVEALEPVMSEDMRVDGVAGSNDERILLGNYDGLFIEDMRIRKTASGHYRVDVDTGYAVNYNERADLHYAMLDNGTFSLDDYSGKDGHEEMAEHARNANEAMDFSEDAERVREAVVESLAEKSNRSVGEIDQVVDVKVNEPQGAYRVFSTSDVWNRYNTYLEAQADEAWESEDVETMKAIVSHPQASTEVYIKAREYLSGMDSED